MPLKELHVILRNVKFQLEIDGRQKPLHLKFPPSHTQPESAITLSNTFNPVTAEHARDFYLIHWSQSAHPTRVTTYSTWPGCGGSSVSRKHLRILRFLTIPFAPANLRFLTHFGEEYGLMFSIHSVVEVPARRRNLILTTLSKLLFDQPVELRERLEKLWVDNLVYNSAWRKHVSEGVEDLQQIMTWVNEPLFSVLVFKLIHL